MAKLALIVDAAPDGVAAQVRTYLLSIFEDFPDALFQDNQTAKLESTPQDAPAKQAPQAAVMRSSKPRFEILRISRVEKQNRANDLAGLGLLLVRRTRDAIPPYKISCWPTIPALSPAKFLST